jgi:hypothetical protein
MKHRYLRSLPCLIALALGLVVIGCGGGSNPTNCLSQSDVDSMIASAGLSDCKGGLPCGDHEAVESFPDGYLCAYQHTGSSDTCGAVDNHGCNTWGHYTARLLTGSCGTSCYTSFNISDTLVSCNNATTAAPCGVPTTPGGPGGG